MNCEYEYEREHDTFVEIRRISELGCIASSKDLAVRGRGCQSCRTSSELSAVLCLTFVVVHQGRGGKSEAGGSILVDTEERDEADRSTQQVATLPNML